MTCFSAVGIGNTIAPMYLSEIAPFNYRGAFGTVHQLLVTGGIFLSSVFGLKELLGTQYTLFLLLLLAKQALLMFTDVMTTKMKDKKLSYRRETARQLRMST